MSEIIDMNQWCSGPITLMGLEQQGNFVDLCGAKRPFTLHAHAELLHFHFSASADK